MTKNFQDYILEIQHFRDAQKIVQDIENRIRITKLDNIVNALRECSLEGNTPLFMPELEFFRRHIGFSTRYITPSLFVTGKTRIGTPVAVCAHVPHYYSDPTNLETAINGNRILNGAGRLPKEEFYRLIDLDGNGRVFVLDYDLLNRWPRGYYNIDKPSPYHMKTYNGRIESTDMIAINHPFIIPFFGSRELAEGYLTRQFNRLEHDPHYYESFKNDQLGIFYKAEIDEEPLGRFLSTCGIDSSTPCCLHAEYLYDERYNERFVALRAN